MVHIGTYPCMNISQQLTLPVDPVSVAETHSYRYLESHGYTKWCITILIILHVYCVTACHILALKMSALCVPQINTICIQDIIFALIDIKCQPVRRCSYRGGHLGHKDVCGANTLH